jgi:hypoxanthine phosphoribosyltransferase
MHDSQPQNTPPRLTVLLPRHQIAARVAELAAQIGTDYANQPLLLLCVLKGAAIFMADLARAIPAELVPHCRFDFIALRSYGASTQSSGSVHLVKDADADIAGRHVLVVEDILDTGNTLAWLLPHLAERGPASVRVAVLLDKPSRRVQNVQADYVAFTISDRFVVGYGLDYGEKYRNLADICVLG